MNTTSNTEQMRPTPHTLARRARRQDADWIADQRSSTHKRASRGRGQLRAIRESIQDFS